MSILIPFFEGKDARYLDEFIFLISETKVIKVSSGSGMSVVIDPVYLSTHKVIRT